MPHVGHTWPVTQPRLFATVVRPFLTAPNGDVTASGNDPVSGNDPAPRDAD